MEATLIIPTTPILGEGGAQRAPRTPVIVRFPVPCDHLRHNVVSAYSPNIAPSFERTHDRGEIESVPVRRRPGGTSVHSCDEDHVEQGLIFRQCREALGELATASVDASVCRKLTAPAFDQAAT